VAPPRPVRARLTEGWKCRLFADEEPQHVAEHVPPEVRPVPAGRWSSVLLLLVGLLATASLSRHGGYAAAVALHDVEQLAPERAG
jgi:hypothetical protein